MYVPNHFRLPDAEAARILADGRAGNLVTLHNDVPLASFVPMHLEQREDSQVLVTHLVRNNPQAREPITGRALAIFDITDAYVAPQWHATNTELANVPTWDYVTVHVTGFARIDPSPEAALEAARALTLRMEDASTLDAVGEAKLGRMARAIVAVELRVDSIEGKAKMSQNRHPDDVRSLAEHFEKTGPAELARYLREVSLPYAQERFAKITSLRDRPPTEAERADP